MHDVVMSLSHEVRDRFQAHKDQRSRRHGVDQGKELHAKIHEMHYGEVKDEVAT